MLESSILRLQIALLVICLLLLWKLWVQPKQATRFHWSVGAPVPKQPGQKERIMLEIKITNEQKIAIGVNPVTATGNPAPLDGPVEFIIESGDCTIEVIDERSAFIVSGSNPGDSVVIVKADADLGEGVELIQDIVKVTVEGAKAASLGLTVGEPVAK